MKKYNVLVRILLLSVPLFGYFAVRNNPYYMHLAILYLLWVLLGQSWNIIGGYTGLVSFGNAIFYGIGAYAAALTFIRFGWPAWAGFLSAIVIAGVVAWPFGALTFHLRGAYFVNVTFAASEIVRLLALNMRHLTGGPAGILLPPVFTSRAPFYFLIAALVTVVTIVIMFLENSKPGLYFQAIRESPEASEALGIDTKRYKFIALFLSAFFAGCAGAFYAYYMCYIDPNIMFGLPINSTMILVVAIGGAGTAFGAYGGGLVVVAISEIFRQYFGGAHLFAYGSLLILVPMFMPDGIAGALRKLGGVKAYDLLTKGRQHIDKVRGSRGSRRC